MERKRQEKKAFEFRLDEHGNFVPVSNEELTGDDKERQASLEARINRQTEVAVEVKETIGNILSKGKLEDLPDEELQKILISADIPSEIKATFKNLKMMQEVKDRNLEDYITFARYNPDTDIFLGPTNIIIENRFNYDVNPEEMTEEQRELYEFDCDNEDDLEDDFILLANEGVLPINLSNQKNVQIVSQKEEQLEGDKEEKFNEILKEYSEEKPQFSNKDFFADPEFILAAKEMRGVEKEDDEEEEEEEEMEEYDEDGNLVETKPKKEKQCEPIEITEEQINEIAQFTDKVNEEEIHFEPEEEKKVLADITCVEHSYKAFMPKVVKYTKEAKQESKVVKKDSSVEENKQTGLISEEEKRALFIKPIDKEANKLRKKQLKQQKKEVLGMKKELKEMFSKEKKSQQHNIAKANEGGRFGQSVKDIL